MKIWESPAGEIKLKRHPFSGGKSHQAWDAADGWIIRRLSEPASPALIVGEAFGVLGTVWGSADLTVLSDSLLSLSALELNRSLNPEKTGGSLKILRTTDDTSAAFETIILRLPKDLGLLELYIRQTQKYARGSTEIWVGGMDRRWSRGAKSLIEKYFNIAETFPFERHARWLRCTPADPQYVPAPEASAEKPVWEIEEFSIKIKPAPAVFSSGSVDGGTAAFLESFPEAAAKSSRVTADLGCGAGILGLCAARLNPQSEVIFTDESFTALRSADNNFRLNKLAAKSRFIAANGLEGVPDGSVDLVLCNPPFHYQNIQTLDVALFMFEEARRVLVPGGTIQLVGNSHLGYHKHLRQYFPNAREVFRNKKFVVLRGSRESRQS
ncbi:MAG: hypothetical protein CSA83_02045 [Actinomycetales bacterium]|nr:MAG: hypothetical protein CSA83_02045 [Actinomycetales bacterium]